MVEGILKDRDIVALRGGGHIAHIANHKPQALAESFLLRALPSDGNAGW